MIDIPAPTKPVPAEVSADVRRLAAALEAEIPGRADDNLLIGTWNLRALSDLTPKWRSASEDSPKRDWHAMACIAELIKRFDVAAIQETRRDVTALAALLGALGDRYQVIVSDVTEGDAGNGERLAFIYDSDRVRPSGLVGEVVLPMGRLAGGEQFARTPYVAGFVRSGVEFILTTVHVVWGERPADRVAELRAFAEWMRAWADRPKDWNRNMLVLGDFNLDRIDDPLFEAFVSTGLWPPAELNHVPRTIFADDNQRHFYDQIAWFSDPADPEMPSLLDGLTYNHRGGSFDFVPHVLRSLTKNQLSWRISDHYPLWVEFEVANG